MGYGSAVANPGGILHPGQKEEKTDSDVQVDLNGQRKIWQNVFGALEFTNL